MMKTVLLPAEELDSEKFASLAYRKRWTLNALRRAHPEKGQRAELVLETKNGVQIRFITEYALGDVDYIAIEGDDAATVTQELSSDPAVPLISKESVFDSLEKGAEPKSLLVGLRRLAVLAPDKQEEPYARLFRLGLEHFDAEVRRVAVQATLYPRWPSLRTIVERMAEGDPDSGVRGHASVALQAFDEPDAAAAAYLQFGALDAQIPELPKWLDRLKNDSDRMPWQWLDTTGRAPMLLRSRVARETKYVELNKEVAASCRERVNRSYALATGAIRRNRLSDGQPYAEGRLWFDPQFPNLLWLDLGKVIPAFWAPVDPNASAVGKATKFYFSENYPTQASLRRSFRFYGGRPNSILYDVRTGQRESNDAGTDEEVVERYSEQAPFNDALEYVYWGSAVREDPYPEGMDASPTALGAIVREFSKQEPGRASVSFRTRWSGSVVTIESHFREVVIVDVAYRPAPHSSGYAAVVPYFAQLFPYDLPVDAAEAIRRFRIITEDVTRATLGTDEDDEELRLIIGALSAKRPEFDAELETWSQESDISTRRAAARIAAKRGRVDLLRAMAKRETNKKLAEQLAEALRLWDEEA